jgi:quercetin dioxygenase-like cupin family protein
MRSFIVKWSEFPERIRALEKFSGRFQAFRLRAESCDVLFGTYPAGTRIEPHRHDTDNWGVITKGEMVIAMNGSETRYRPGDWYHIPAQAEHAARCDADTEEIEFWFRVA